MTKKTNGAMLITLRESQGLTQLDLSKKTGLTQAAISKLEKDEFELKDENLNILASSLNVWPSMFSVEEHIYDNNFVFFFRKRQLSKKILKQIESTAKLNCLHLKLILKEKSNLNTEKLDALRKSCAGLDPVQAAIKVRDYFQLKNGPINNLTNIVEQLGVVVIDQDFFGLNIDGFHLKCDSRHPLIFINKDRSSDRNRFTLAHELGHLLLHDQLEENIEEEANQFASELLIPTESASSQLMDLNIKRLMSLKSHWKVSMQALIMKAKQCNLIPYNRYNYLWIQMSRLGYRKQEPVEIPKEPICLFGQILRTFFEERQMDLELTSKHLHLTTEGFLSLYGSRLEIQGAT